MYTTLKATVENHYISGKCITQHLLVLYCSPIISIQKGCICLNLTNIQQAKLGDKIRDNVSDNLVAFIKCC